MSVQTIPVRPPFQICATGRGLLTPAEMEGLIARHGPAVSEGRVEEGVNRQHRRSRTAFLRADAETTWLYERIWQAAQDMNRLYFGVELSGMQEAIQLARYDASDSGFYDWHMDFGGSREQRKLSITVQLSDPADYDGGDLELMFREQAFQAERERGMIVAFPSFALHRVSPVTRGVRWSLVAWISGPRWR